MTGDEGLPDPTSGVKKAAVKPAVRSKKKTIAPKKAASRRKKAATPKKAAPRRKKAAAKAPSKKVRSSKGRSRAK
jgi:hypothetical protein